MAKISQYFKDKAKTIKDYPKTLIKAVYGDDGKRLDNIISDITSDIDSTKAKIGTTDISQYSDGTVTGAVKSACDKANTNEAATADVNNKLGNTDISAIGDGTLTGGLDALNSNLLIKGYIDKNIGDVQLNSYGYLDIRDHMPTNKTVVLAGIKTFGASASAWSFNITADGRYIIGAGGDSISNLMIRYYYS